MMQPDKQTLRLNVAKAIEQTIKYYKAEVGDRMSNVYEVADAVIAECAPVRELSAEDDLYLRHGKAIFEFAKKLKWKKEDGEGPLEYIQRLSYRQGLDDAGHSNPSLDEALNSGNGSYKP